MKRTIYKYLPYVALLILSVIFAFPLFVMLTTSFKTYEQAFDLSIGLLPPSLYFGSYRAVFETIPFVRYFLNTLFITLMNVAGTLITTPMIAYSLSKLRWRGRDLFFAIVVSTLLIPYTVIMIPLYKVWVKLRLVGTFWPLIIPGFFGYPFYIILLRQFMLTVPDELLEAAKIDGCSPWKRYTAIILPLAKPGMATVAIFTFLNTFSDFLGPLLYLNKTERYTLSLGLQSFLNEHSVAWTNLMAASALFMLPIVVAFVLGQKYFIEGISTTGIK